MGGGIKHSLRWRLTARVFNVGKREKVLFAKSVEDLLDIGGHIADEENKRGRFVGISPRKINLDYTPREYSHDSPIRGRGRGRDDVAQILLNDVTSELDASFIVLWGCQIMRYAKKRITCENGCGFTPLSWKRNSSYLKPSAIEG